ALGLLSAGAFFWPGRTADPDPEQESPAALAGDQPEIAHDKSFTAEDARRSSPDIGCVWTERPIALPNGLGEAGLARFIFDENLPPGQPVVEPAGYELHVRIAKPAYHDS